MKRKGAKRQNNTKKPGDLRSALRSSYLQPSRRRLQNNRILSLPIYLSQPSSCYLLHTYDDPFGVDKTLLILSMRLWPGKGNRNRSTDRLYQAPLDDRQDVGHHAGNDGNHKHNP